MTYKSKNISLTFKAGAIAILLLMAGLLSIEAKNSEEPAIKNYASERSKALALFDNQRFVEALPILKELYDANPDDLVVLEALAWSTFMHSTTFSRKEDQKKERMIAHELGIKARKRGSSNGLIQILIELPPDGGELKKSSDRKEVADIMSEAESAFAHGDFKKAIAFYERVLQLDPKHYEAVLFIGDSYYKQDKIDKACRWFAKAIEINSDRETAYRYWGDALLSENKKDESLEKFIEAVIAEPYSRRVYSGLANWSMRYGKQLGNPRLDVPMSSSYDNENKTVNISVRPSKNQDVAGVWVTYSLVRAVWQSEKKFKEEFPNEREYRHSLREETDALKRTAEAVVEQMKAGKLEKNLLDVSIQNLLKLHAAGLIEAYVLLVKPDAGIARDYNAYRKENREKLRKYLAEVMVNGGVINDGINPSSD